MEADLVNLLFLVVVQEQDQEAVTRALEQLQLPVVCLASTGGFLDRRNVTLLVGVRKNCEDDVHKALENSSRQRIDYLMAPSEGSFFPYPTPLPVAVSGATLFTFPVDHFEEI